MSPAPARVPLPSVATITALVVSLLASSSADAGFLERYIGNTRAKNANGTFDSTFAFAVLDQETGASSPGDIFGTGFPDFDTSVAPASEALDITARYLYLYQDLNDGPLIADLTGLEFNVIGKFSAAVPGAVTSVVHWNLVLSDDAGRFSTTNQFGQDGATFQVDAYAIRGGTNAPGVTTPLSSLLASDTFSYAAGTGILTVNYQPDLAPGAMGPLYGFTSDLPPSYFIPVDTDSGVASGEFPVISVTDGFLADFIGNTRAKNETNTRDETWSFAVLDQLSSASAPGDVFGTGVPTFDADTGIDTTARFLFLYQDINDGTLTDPIPVVNVPADGATSFVEDELIFTDDEPIDDGEFSTTNQFGEDGAAHAVNADASIGVVDPGLAAASVTLAPASTAFDAPSETFTITYNFGMDPGLEPGEIGPLYGFTSNIRPGYDLPFGEVNGKTPVPLPEPSTELILAAAIAALLTGQRVRSTVRRAK